MNSINNIFTNNENNKALGSNEYKFDVNCKTFMISVNGCNHFGNCILLRELQCVLKYYTINQNIYWLRIILVMYIDIIRNIHQILTAIIYVIFSNIICVLIFGAAICC